MLNKVKSNKGGSALIVIMIGLILVFLSIIPAIIDSSTMEIGSKKLKSSINAASNSVAISIADVNSNGMVTYDPSKGAPIVKNFFEELFDKSFYQITTPVSNSNYYTISYKDKDNTIAVQYIFYYKDLSTKEPSSSLVNSYIRKNSLGENVDITSISNTVRISKPTVLILLRYDINSYTSKRTKTMVRYGASQINIK